MAHESEERAMDMMASYGRGMLDLQTLTIALKGIDWGRTPVARSEDMATAWVEAADLQSSSNGGSITRALTIAQGRKTITAKQASEIYSAYQA